ncbi:alpha/beta hydrolase [Evansella cellulosilytica]|nr:alpha/beta fold hydrolase [Evansella cellulosilytica]
MNHPSIIQGAEAFHLKGNDVGILLCHGFVGTPQSMETIGRKFAAKGFTVRAPRLTGHGTDPYDFEKATYHDWITDLEENYLELKKTCSQIFVVGQSMGGLLALIIAGRFKDIAGVITLNVAYEVPGLEMYRNKISPRFIEESAPDIKNKNVHEITYPYIPITAINELLSVAQYTKQHIHQVECPVLLFRSSVDHVVPPESTNDAYDQLQTTQKEIITLTNSYHVASMDYDNEKIINDSVTFISKTTRQQGQVPCLI